MITTLIFDLDGTLGDTEELHFKAWRTTLLDHGVPEFTFEDFCAYVGTSNEKVAGDYLTQCKSPTSIDALIAYKQKLYIQLIPQVKLCSGARDCILRTSKNYTLALASSSHEKEVRAILSSHNLLSYFSAIMCGDMVSKRKPDPEIYLKTADALGKKPRECMAFEDTEHGLNAAKAAGMYGIAIPTELSRHHDFSAADIIIKSLNVVDDAFIKDNSK